MRKISTDCISNAAIIYGQSVTPLEKRLKARICELCGTTESERYEIHHINKLKNLKGKETVGNRNVSKTDERHL